MLLQIYISHLELCKQYKTPPKNKTKNQHLPANSPLPNKNNNNTLQLFIRGRINLEHIIKRVQRPRQKSIPDSTTGLYSS